MEFGRLVEESSLPDVELVDSEEDMAMWRPPPQTPTTPPPKESSGSKHYQTAAQWS
jgi:hypothetical protein